MRECDAPFARDLRQQPVALDPQRDGDEMRRQHQMTRLVFGVFISGSTDTTIGNSRIALTVTAIAACTAVAPEPSVEIRMICAGPAQTKSVLPSAQPRLK